jgi:hypothetical protein
VTLSPFPPSVVSNAYNIPFKEKCSFSLNPFVTMPSTKYLKVKERLVLALHIENSNKEANPCLYCRRQARYYLIDPKESSRYSKYVRSKRLYNLLGLKTVSII